MRTMYAGLQYSEHIPDATFFAFEVKVLWGTDGQPGAHDQVTGLVRRLDDGTTAYVDPERGGWIDAPLNLDRLEAIGLTNAEQAAHELGVGLEDPPIGNGPAPESAPEPWDYYAIVLSDGTRHGLLRRKAPFAVERLTDDGWASFPGLERMFTVGVGGDQGDVAPLSLDEARKRAIELGGGTLQS
jgi:hypothetical protein